MNFFSLYFYVTEQSDFYERAYVIISNGGFVIPRISEFSEYTDSEIKGSNFIGWNTEEDGTGTTYNEGDSFIMPNNDVTLYAMWKSNL
ncbi:MAG: InlB B-repeat-containing protein [Spirochaetaceae bacterium]|nr:InlB B-repeat-containing protein [Spirochaetaceae bacterium]